MAKTKAQKRLEANIRNLNNHFVIIHRLVAIMPGGKDFDLAEYKGGINYLFARLRSNISALQSSCKQLRCSMVGHIDTPNQINYVQDPLYQGMPNWEIKNIIKWLYDDYNLPAFVEAVNKEMDLYPHCLETIPFDRHVYDAIHRQVRFYVDNHTNN